MLKYIFRSATGSFSRTIGRILAYALIGILILFLSGFLNIGIVKAEQANPWFSSIEGVSFSSNAEFYTFQSGNYNKLSFLYDVVGRTKTGYQENSGYSYTDSFGWNSAISGNYWGDKISLTFHSDIKFDNDYFYSVTSYVCSANYLGDAFATTSSNSLDSLTSVPKYSNTSRTAYSDRPFDSWINTATVNYCYSYTTLINPPGGNWFSLTWNVTPTTEQNFVFLGYNVEALGLAKDSILDNIDLIIDKSGLASASSVEEVQNSVNDVKKQIEETNNTLKDDKVDGAQGSANSFFENFEDKDYGLSGVITMPLTFINKITSGTCTPLSFSAPFVDQDITLPCMYNIYTTYFGDFLSVYQTITFGVVSYWVCVNIFQMVKNFKDPDKDEIEVLDL